MTFMCRAAGLLLLLTSTPFTVGTAMAATPTNDTIASATSIVSGYPGAVGTSSIQIVSYDVKDTPQTGWGGWTHDYDGTITETGRTVSGSVFTGRGNYLAAYEGGSGSLNDGVLVSNTHLFVTRNADDGLPIQPVVTLHLAQRSLVESITIKGGAGMFAGGIVSATVEVAQGASAHLPGTPAGDPGYGGVLVDDVFTLPSALAATPTDTVTLSEFTSMLSGQPFDQFTIDEITVTGAPAAPVQKVVVDVKPGDRRPVIQPKSAGLTAVAILSTAEFDASKMVDPRTVTFGRTGTEVSIARWRVTRVNGDRRPDLLLLARTRDLGFSGGETVAHLRGRTFQGVVIEGSDKVTVLARR